jgi:hypothetical protein
MKKRIELNAALMDVRGDAAHRLSVFALLNLGIVQSLASRVISAEDAIPLFYNADNCLYVRKQLRNKHAEAIMSRGVQLPDLFEHLPAGKAYREFTHELEAIRAHCLALLNKTRSATAA